MHPMGTTADGIPDDIVAALKTRPDARDAFYGLGDEHRAELICYVTEARDDRQRRTRIDLLLASLRP